MLSPINNYRYSLHKATSSNQNRQITEIMARKKTILLVSILFYSLLALPTLAREKFQSLIVRPNDIALKEKIRIDRVLINTGITSFKKSKSSRFLVPVDKKLGSRRQIRKLMKTGVFKYVEPNHIINLDEKNYVSVEKTLYNENYYTSYNNLSTNDTEFNNQPDLSQIKATKAWNLSTGNEDIIVAVIDSGINATHTELSGKVFGRPGHESYDLTDVLALGHGTAVSGIIAAKTNNLQGIASVGRNAKILSIRVFNSGGKTDTDTIASALEDAYENGARIAQISASTPSYSKTLSEAVELAQERGILIVSTAGNTSTNESELKYPGAFPGVLCVGSVDSNNNHASHSVTGAHVNLVAPGVNIKVLQNGGGYREATGTSFASPMISGIAVLLLGINPNLTNEELRSILILSADDLGESGKDSIFGFGIVDALKAALMAEETL